MDPQLAKALGYALVVIALIKSPVWVPWLFGLAWGAMSEVVLPLAVIFGCTLICTVASLVFLGNATTGIMVGFIVGCVLVYPRNSSGSGRGFGKKDGDDHHD
jgi:hypothetical protein